MSGGKLWLISGETSDGKSMLAMNLVRAFIDETSQPPSTWEMPDEDITKRVLADVQASTRDFHGRRETHARIKRTSHGSVGMDADQRQKVPS